MSSINSYLGHEKSWVKEQLRAKWMNDLINRRWSTISQWTSQTEAGRQIQPNRHFSCFFLFFLFRFSLGCEQRILIRPAGSGVGPRRLHRAPMVPGFSEARQICLSLYLFCRGVCFSHCLCLCTFPLLAFSSVSPTLAIFCLVASNVALCLSAVTTQLIYIYLHIQEMTARN